MVRWIEEYDHNQPFRENVISFGLNRIEHDPHAVRPPCPASASAFGASQRGKTGMRIRFNIEIELFLNEENAPGG
jgi:hypothetical protein